MKVKEYKANRVSPAYREYDTDLTDIKDVALAFGEKDDILELYNDKGKLVAIAIWPMGYKIYKYSTEPEILDAWSNYYQR